MIWYKYIEDHKWSLKLVETELNKASIKVALNVPNVKR
jgi:hypothetical protein